MNFIVGLPMMSRRNDSILVVVGTLTKSIHFILVKNTYQSPEITRVFINEIVRLHGIMKSTILDRGLVFMGRFWTSFRQALVTQLNFSKSCHLEIDG